MSNRNIAVERISLPSATLETPDVYLLIGDNRSSLRDMAKELSELSGLYWSRSYRNELALVATWKRKVGIDIEFLGTEFTSEEPLFDLTAVFDQDNDRTLEWSAISGAEKPIASSALFFSEQNETTLADIILTEEENTYLSSFPDEDKISQLLKIWSAKEALTKALGDALSYNPKFLTSPVMWPESKSGRWHYVSFDPVESISQIMSKDNHSISKPILDNLTISGQYIASLVYEVI